MNRSEFLENLMRCLEKADLLTSYSVSFDADEIAELYIDPSDVLFLDGVKTPYGVADVRHIMYYREREFEEDGNYVKISFFNGDWLTLYPYTSFCSVISGNMYNCGDALSMYRILSPDETVYSFASEEDVLQKLKNCLEKANISTYTVQEDKNQIADLMFLENRFFIDENVETPFSVSDFWQIQFSKGKEYESPMVDITFKNGEEIHIFPDYEYEAYLHEGKHLSCYLSFDAIRKLRQRVNAIERGIDGNEFVILDGILTAYNGNSSVVTIPEGVTIIEEGIFEQSVVTEVFFPHSLTVIGDCAFRCCTGLEKIHLNEGLLTIGSRAFCGCQNLVYVTLPSTLKEIQGAAFAYSGVGAFTGIPDSCKIAPDALKQS